MTHRAPISYRMLILVAAVVLVVAVLWFWYPQHNLTLHQIHQEGRQWMTTRQYR